MRRMLLLAIIACAFALAWRESHHASPAPAAAQATERVQFRQAPPSCAQAIKDLHLEEQTVNCEEPPPPTYDPPQMHGKYRLVPESYVGPLTYEDKQDTAPAGLVSHHTGTISISPIYAESS